MNTIRLTTAQAIVKYLIAQRTIIDGDVRAPVRWRIRHLRPRECSLPCRGAVPGSGRVADVARTQRAVDGAGRGGIREGEATPSDHDHHVVGGTRLHDMITAAATAHANRLPLLIFSGDTFQHRFVDPALQQLEHFDSPSTTVSDAYRAATRYWDRISRPEQIIQSLPQAVAAMLDPADRGPAYIGLPQDIAAEVYDYSTEFFATQIHYIRQPIADRRDIDRAAALLAAADKPLIIAGGGVHYSGAVAELTAFAEKRGIPVTETVAGKATLLADHPNFVGPLGVTRSTSAKAMANEADVVVAVGTRFQDFTTGSWSVFGNEKMSLISVNVGRFDATKHRAISVIGDAKTSLEDLEHAIGDCRAPATWLVRAGEDRRCWYAYLDEFTSIEFDPPTYAQVIRAVDEICDPDDYQLSTAGGLPDELNMGWHSKSVGSFDAEYGYSCMGYEIAGAWGAKMALPDRDVVSWVGDGSYLMMNSDIYSTVMTGRKAIFILCDSGGFAVINRLQVNTGGEEFNNLLHTTRHERMLRVDFAKECRIDEGHQREGHHRRRIQGGVRACQSGGSQLRDRHRGLSVRLDRGWRVVGGRRTRCVGSRAGPGRPSRARRREEAAAARDMT
jgi:3D-(3,5/4)-trihydroxycyclohexane-1,2-dione acylhydrolase (decyclizing)